MRPLTDRCAEASGRNEGASGRNEGASERTRSLREDEERREVASQPAVVGGFWGYEATKCLDHLFFIMYVLLVLD